LDRRGQNFY